MRRSERGEKRSRADHPLRHAAAADRICAVVIRDFDPAAFIPPLKLRRVDAVGRIALALPRCSLTMPAGPARRRPRRDRHRARDYNCRPGQHRRVSGRSDRSRADRRAGDSFQQHGFQRAGQPVRDRARAARAERHFQPARSVEPRALLLSRRGHPRRARDRDGQRRRGLSSRKSSSRSTIGSARFHRSATASSADEVARPFDRRAQRFRARRRRVSAVPGVGTGGGGARPPRLWRDPRRRCDRIEDRAERLAG